MKDRILKRAGFTEVTALEMYTDIFKLGQHYIQVCNEPAGLFKTNPIAIIDDGHSTRQVIMFEDQFEQCLNEFATFKAAYMSCLTYWGKRNLSDSQSKMYAMVFDLDGIGDKRLSHFIDGYLCGIYPVPNYVVLSGSGIHLYYVFEDPISLYPNTKQQLKELKYALTEVIWNPDTSRIKTPQYQGINQSYRIPGTKTKKEGLFARAFRLNEHPTSIGYLNSFVPEDKRVNLSKLYSESSITLEEAKALWPEWYQRRILNKEPKLGWKTNRTVYDWWKTKIFRNAEFGHRYFCVMALAIYAVKCGIAEEELKRDALAFKELLNVIHPEDPFTEDDMNAALECYDQRYITFPRKDIARLTGIDIPENKRNHRTKWEHLQAETWEIDGEQIDNPCKANREKAWEKAREEGRITGRPKGSGTKQDIVADYFRKYPDATITQAHEDTKLSRTTIQKWKPKGLCSEK